jgi:hypothetical protein
MNGVPQQAGYRVRQHVKVSERGIRHAGCAEEYERPALLLVRSFGSEPVWRREIEEYLCSEAFIECIRWYRQVPRSRLADEHEDQLYHRRVPLGTARSLELRSPPDNARVRLVDDEGGTAAVPLERLCLPTVLPSFPGALKAGAAWKSTVQAAYEIVDGRPNLREVLRALKADGSAAGPAPPPDGHYEFSLGCSAAVAEADERRALVRLALDEPECLADGEHGKLRLRALGVWTMTLSVDDPLPAGLSGRLECEIDSQAGAGPRAVRLLNFATSFEIVRVPLRFDGSHVYPDANGWNRVELERAAARPPPAPATAARR